MKRFAIGAILFANSSCAAQEVMLESRAPITPAFYGKAIHQSDLALSSSPMYSIKSSGRYYLASDLRIDAGANSLAVIQINANNVNLNLNEAVIYQDASDSSIGLIGIEVSDDKSNISIMDGSINGGTKGMINGIKVGSGANNIKIENMTIMGCTSATAEVSAIYLDTCSNVHVKDCTLNSNTNTKAISVTGSGTASGVLMVYCENCLLENCTASGNVSTDQGAIGFKLGTSCKYNKIYNCVSSDMTSQTTDSNDGSYGFYSSSGEGNIFDSCKSVGGVAAGTGATISVGFRFSGTEKHSSIINCSASLHNGGDAGTASIGYGIWLSSGVTYCEIRNNKLIGNTGAAAGYGIRDYNSSSTNMYVQNFAYANGVDSTAGVDNYSVVQAGTPSTFQVLTGDYGDFADLSLGFSNYKNVEIVE